MAQLGSTLRMPNTCQQVVVQIRQKWIAPYLQRCFDSDVIHCYNIETEGVDEGDWRYPYIKYLSNPSQERLKLVRQRAVNFVLIEGVLYRRGADGILLRCLSRPEADRVMAEVHEGICGAHQAGPKMRWGPRAQLISTFRPAGRLNLKLKNRGGRRQKKGAGPSSRARQFDSKIARNYWSCFVRPPKNYSMATAVEDREDISRVSYIFIEDDWENRKLRKAILSLDKAATKAMPVNRVGDFGSAPGISGRFTLFQTVDSSTIFARASAPRNSWISRNMRLNAITLICILLLIGAAGKSAQIGSHTWSPDAMEGPTPVSASIHAATTVTAGVFMIARCSPLFEYPPTALIVITSAGATTSFLAATTGILQNDPKRVIAYSTCSQLGYMIFACGISNYSVSVFHLMNHAFFKALLFLSAGSVIHAMSDEQDMRKMGGLASSFPFTYAMMLMGSLSLIGFPFPTGFYSKDVILELAYTKYTISGNFAFWLGSVSVLFTSYYSFRSLFLTFLVPTNSFGRDILRCHDAPIPMAIPSILLALGSLFVGYLAKV
ncbi:hypothetical protein HHK36_031419 (mitochondrion) [Tetracentron sinense]|uniref:NADH:quinone oxidoreductase/Mrp antiporter transmembrane domain-containing protein n=1 Tax=Tetracentron sinense TaxID=13715 RepID=A0A835D0H1_TETSI|nr:hypothetical protein LWB77_mgp06 [Tetracentron sinense]KAF8364967.1 hypothetical protein HHK36_033059 [Tetracentron sinense]KAF8376901.1 hypothetical protein HHK36_031419 [Tetracentron sinense]